jgi:flavin reductase (DIM6/NTAB) family NADH-FMN oxidoreductase RutF
VRRLRPGETSSREIFQALTSLVAPRPIAFVSTLSARGEGNLAPFSYFNLGGGNPPSVVFSVLNDRQGREKDTLLNIRETGEYCISVVPRPMVERMNLTSPRYPRGVNEFGISGLTPAPSELIAPPRVAESPVALECRRHTIVAHGAGPLAGNYIIGEVLLILFDEAILDPQGRIDPERLGLVGRLGGDWYALAAGNALFELPRPPDPPPSV